LSVIYLLQTAELSGIRIMSGANWKFAQRVMRIQLERFVAAARISEQATISAEFCLIFILHFSVAATKWSSDSLAPPLPSRAARRQRNDHRPEERGSGVLIRYVSIISKPKNLTIGSKSLSSCNNVSWWWIQKVPIMTSVVFLTVTPLLLKYL